MKMLTLLAHLDPIKPHVHPEDILGIGVLAFALAIVFLAFRRKA